MNSEHFVFPQDCQALLDRMKNNISNLQLILPIQIKGPEKSKLLGDQHALIDSLRAHKIESYFNATV